MNNISINNIDLKNKANKSNSFLSGINSYKLHVDDSIPEDSEVFTLNKITYKSLYFNFIQFSLMLFFIFLCIKEFQSVIESVKKIKTFNKKNVSSFRKIGKYLSLLFIISSYSSITFQQGGISSFQFNFTYLILALLAYIMSEIFREGNNLAEENKLTV